MGSARAATIDDLKSLLRALNKEGVDYLLIGGHALGAHGFNRATEDIDILLPTSVEVGERVQRALMILPEGAAHEIDPLWFPEGETIRVADAFVVDLLFNANGHTFDALRPFAEIIDFDGIPLRTVSLEGLLLTKQTLSAKDALDRVILGAWAAENRRLQNARKRRLFRPLFSP